MAAHNRLPRLHVRLCRLRGSRQFCGKSTFVPSPPLFLAIRKRATSISGMRFPTIFGFPHRRFRGNRSRGDESAGPCGTRKPVKRVLGNRGAAADTGESERGEATKDVASESVCAQFGAGSVSPQPSRSQKTMTKRNIEPGYSNGTPDRRPFCAVSEVPTVTAGTPQLAQTVEDFNPHPC